MRLRRDPLPRMLIEDLVAVARMLYRSWRAKDASQHKLRQLSQVGRKLRQALELAKMPVVTLERAKAWQLAEEATEELGRLVGSEERTVTLVTAVFDGLDRPQRPSAYQERDAERLPARLVRIRREPPRTHSARKNPWLTSS
ncbi:MAG: hypothetical protein ABJB12_11805 [Pseudomonadota bacterium]